MGFVTKLMAGSLLPPAGLLEGGQFEANNVYIFLFGAVRDLTRPDKRQSENEVEGPCES